MRRDVGWIVLAALTAVLAALVFRRGNESATAGIPIVRGEELVMLFIASSTCAGIDAAGLPDAVRKIRKGLEARARSQGILFVTAGIALDVDPDRGLRMLERFGPFHEVSSGRSWLNTAAIRYIWKEHQGAAAIPQVIVLTRSIEKDRAIQIPHERVHVRKVGAIDIVNWAELGFSGGRPTAARSLHQ